MEGQIPTGIAKLLHLKELLLSSNSFVGASPTEFVNLKKVKTIMTIGNNLEKASVKLLAKRQLIQFEPQTATAIIDLEKE